MENKYYNALIDYVSKHLKDYEKRLLKAPYNLKNIGHFAEHPNWRMFNYNLFESDLDNDVVKASRGSILEILEDGTVTVICGPYTKFFDINDPHADIINWASKKLKVEEKCVSADTIVETENGKKTIKEVVEGDDKFVVSVNEENGDLELAEITNKWCKNTDNEWYEIETESGKKIKITGNDFLRLSNGAYRRVDELQINDEVIIR